MKAVQRPDPDQALFRFVWHDPADDRPDGPEDDRADVDDRPAAPPLRSHVRARPLLRPGADAFRQRPR